MICNLARSSPCALERTITDYVIPVVPLAGTLSSLIDDRRSTSSETGAVRFSRDPTDGLGIVITPTPPPTDAVPVRPVSPHDPPRSAVPHPEATVRPK